MESKWPNFEYFGLVGSHALAIFQCLEFSFHIKWNVCAAYIVESVSMMHRVCVLEKRNMTRNMLAKYFLISLLTVLLHVCEFQT